MEELLLTPSKLLLQVVATPQGHQEPNAISNVLHFRVFPPADDRLKRNTRTPTVQNNSASSCSRPPSPEPGTRSLLFDVHFKLLKYKHNCTEVQMPPTLLQVLEIFKINQREITSTFFPFRPAFQRTAFMKITNVGEERGVGINHNCTDKERNREAETVPPFGLRGENQESCSSLLGEKKT